MRGPKPEQSSLLKVRSSPSPISLPRAVPASHPRVIPVVQGPESPVVSLHPRLWHSLCARPGKARCCEGTMRCSDCRGPRRGGWRVGQGPANTLNAGSILPGNQDGSTEKEGKARPEARAAQTRARSSMNESLELLPWFHGLLRAVPVTGQGHGFYLGQRQCDFPGPHPQVFLHLATSSCPSEGAKSTEKPAPRVLGETLFPQSGCQ